MNTIKAIEDYVTHLTLVTKGKIEDDAISVSRSARYAPILKRLLNSGCIPNKDISDLTFMDLGQLAASSAVPETQYDDAKRALVKVFGNLRAYPPLEPYYPYDGTLKDAVQTLSSWLVDMESGQHKDWSHIVAPRTASNYRCQLNKIIESKLMKQFGFLRTSDMKAGDVHNLYLTVSAKGLGVHKASVSLLKAFKKITGKHVAAFEDLTQPSVGT